MSTVVVAGGGGFIGGALVERLVHEGFEVRAVDVKPLDEWYVRIPGTEQIVANLESIDECRRVVRGAADVYNLAADMGGMGFIENNRALCMLSVLINTHLLVAARDAGVERFFYSSSACVYAASRQEVSDVTALRESDAYPAEPEDGYGWEKLFSERMCRHFEEDFGLGARVGRYHNVYGPRGTWTGGREKAPAAISRKVADALLSGDHVVDVWGDGEQTRSFTFVDDCVEGTRRLMDSDVRVPLNIGSSEMVSINQLTDLVASIAGITVERRHDLTAPLGVRGRNSDNTLCRELLGWEPSVSLRTGMEATFQWVFEQVAAKRAPKSGRFVRSPAFVGSGAPASSDGGALGAMAASCPPIAPDRA